MTPYASPMAGTATRRRHTTPISIECADLCAFVTMCRILLPSTARRPDRADGPVHVEWIKGASVGAVAGAAGCPKRAASLALCVVLRSVAACVQIRSEVACVPLCYRRSVRRSSPVPRAARWRMPSMLAACDASSDHGLTHTHPRGVVSPARRLSGPHVASR